MADDRPAEKPHTVTGDLRTHELTSRALAAARTVAVWLPPKYERDTTSRFPVLYLHDGQNLFDTATAFGVEWQVDETATALIKRGEIEPLIVVGVFNAGDARAEDYTPLADVKIGRGGGLGPHGRMLVEELKPWIDARYRTLPDSPHTALGGSSLGGLATLHLGLRYPTVYGSLAVHSPAVWWADRGVIADVQALPTRLPWRLWLDAGTAEGPNVIPDVRALRDALVQKGWRVGRDLVYLEVEGAGHDEQAWAARVAPMLRFLFPRQKPLERTARALRRWRDRWRESST
jgi:predicted alpha/beta superfamily hydrolase